MPSDAYKDHAWMIHPAVIAGDCTAFVLLTASSIYLHTKVSTYKGPDKDNVFFFGYREEKFLAAYVNFFAALAYWARVCSHANGDNSNIAHILQYKYLDYLVTCPLLTIDLMWSLNLPYKFSCATNVALSILCAFACDSFLPPARYMWFGLGFGLFCWTWITIIRVVRQRLDQFVCKVAKRMRTQLKIAVMTYFCTWCGYPIAWILKEIGVLSPIASALIHVFLDVSAKAVYGIALLEFQMGGDKHAFIFIPLQPDIDQESADKDNSRKREAYLGSSAQMDVYDFQSDEDVEASNPSGGQKKKGAGPLGSGVSDDGRLSTVKDDEEEEYLKGHGGGPKDAETPMQKAQRLVKDWTEAETYGQEVQEMVGEIHAIKEEIEELLSYQSESVDVLEAQAMMKQLEGITRIQSSEEVEAETAAVLDKLQGLSSREFADDVEAGAARAAV